MNNKTTFHFYVSEEISGTEDKRPNITIKDVFVTLITQEILRVWGICEPGFKQRHISYKSQHHTPLVVPG